MARSAAAKDAWNLLKHRGVDALVNDCLVNNIWTFGSFCVVKSRLADNDGAGLTIAATGRVVLSFLLHLYQCVNSVWKGPYLAEAG